MTAPGLGLLDIIRVPGAARIHRGITGRCRNVIIICPDRYRQPAARTRTAAPGTGATASQRQRNPRDLSNNRCAAQTRMKQAHWLGWPKRNPRWEIRAASAEATDHP